MGIGSGGTAKLFGSSPREMFVERAKRNGERTTFIDGKEFAIIGNKFEKEYKEYKEYTESNIEDIEKLLDLSADMPSPTKVIKEKLEEIQEQLGFNPTDTYGSLTHLNDVISVKDSEIKALEARVKALEEILDSETSEEIEVVKAVKKYI